MTCREYLASHSEYVDGSLCSEARARMWTHQQGCCSCARYDRIMRRALDLAHNLPDVLPSSEFRPRLRHRLFHVQDELGAIRPQAPGAAASLAIAALVALVAWSPLTMTLWRWHAERRIDRRAGLVQNTPVGRRPPVVSAAPQPVDPWSVSPTTGMPIQARSFYELPDPSFPGPYSPLVVDPPMVGRPAHVQSATSVIRAVE